MKTKKRLEENLRRIEDCDMGKVIAKVLESGIGFDAEPGEFLVAILEQVGSEFTKKELESIHEINEN